MGHSTNEWIIPKQILQRRMTSSSTWQRRDSLGSRSSNALPYLWLFLVVKRVIFKFSCNGAKQPTIGVFRRTKTKLTWDFQFKYPALPSSPPLGGEASCGKYPISREWKVFSEMQNVRIFQCKMPMAGKDKCLLRFCQKKFEGEG